MMTERDRFETAWANRPWTEDESDKDRAWRWWQAALAPSAEKTRAKLPGYDETMAGLASLTISRGEQ